MYSVACNCNALLLLFMPVALRTVPGRHHVGELRGGEEAVHGDPLRARREEGGAAHVLEAEPGEEEGGARLGAPGERGEGPHAARWVLKPPHSPQDPHTSGWVYQMDFSAYFFPLVVK